MRLISIFVCFGFVFSSCVSDAKRNLDNLKKCKIHLINVIVRLEPSERIAFIPTIMLIPIIEVSNPNEEDVEIYKFNLNLSLLSSKGEEPIGIVKNLEIKTIPKNSAIEFPLTLELDQKNGLPSKFLTLAMQLISSANKGEDSIFLIKGDVQVNSSFGTIWLPVSERQKIKIKN